MVSQEPRPIPPPRDRPQWDVLAHTQLHICTRTHAPAHIHMYLHTWITHEIHTLTHKNIHMYIRVQPCYTITHMHMLTVTHSHTHPPTFTLSQYTTYTFTYLPPPTHTSPLYSHTFTDTHMHAYLYRRSSFDPHSSTPNPDPS